MHFIIWPANNSRHYFISPVRNAGRLGLGGWVGGCLWNVGVGLGGTWRRLRGGFGQRPCGAGLLTGDRLTLTTLWQVNLIKVAACTAAQFQTHTHPAFPNPSFSLAVTLCYRSQTPTPSLPPSPPPPPPRHNLCYLNPSVEARQLCVLSLCVCVCVRACVRACVRVCVAHAPIVSHWQT